MSTNKSKPKKKAPPKTRTVMGVQLPSGFWWVEEGKDGFQLVNKKGHRLPLSKEKMETLELEKRRVSNG